jgi:hypothetical protein
MSGVQHGTRTLRPLPGTWKARLLAKYADMIARSLERPVTAVRVNSDAFHALGFAGFRVRNLDGEVVYMERVVTK